MDFDLTEEQKNLQEMVRKFARKEILPLALEDDEMERMRDDVLKKMGELGLLGVPMSERYGGAGMGYLDYAIVLEELSSASPAYAVTTAVNTLPQMIIEKFGSEEQKNHFLPPLASGEKIGAFCLTEPEAGSDARSLKTSYRRDGRRFVLNGRKLFITNTELAGIYMVIARKEGGEEESKKKVISAFIVEKGTKGLSFGRKENKMGLRAAPTGEVLFDDLEIGEFNLVGKEGEGFRIAMEALDSGRITIAAISVGIAREAYEIALSHARERRQFGQAIINFQGVSFPIAEMAIRIDASRLLTYRAANLRDRRLPHTLEASMAKVFASDTAIRVTTDAVQVLGGYGYSKEFRVEGLMRDAKVMQIVEGTNQIQRLIIARELSKSLNQRI